MEEDEISELMSMSLELGEAVGDLDDVFDSIWYSGSEDGEEEQSSEQADLMCSEEIPATELVIDPRELDPDAVADLPKRVQSKQFALTYPRCDVEPADVMNTIANTFGDKVKWVVVCKEDHKDGTPHLHVALKFKAALRYTDSHGKYWDFLTGQHGNYQRMRSEMKWLRYVIKDGVIVHTEGFDPFAHVRLLEGKLGTTSERVAQSIIEGESLLSLAKGENKGYVLRNLRKMQQYNELIRSDDAVGVSLSLHHVVPQSLSLDEMTIFSWLQSAQQWRGNRRIRHLRITSTPGIGKTSLGLELFSYFNIYSMALEDKWYDMWDDSRYDLVILDEFKGQKSVQQLNLFTDGARCSLVRRGTAPAIHKIKTPCIMFTNFTWEECYPHASPVELVSLGRRWTNVEVTNGEDLFKLIDQLHEITATQELGDLEEINNSNN